MSDDRDRDDAVDRAERELATGDLNAALRSCQAALAADPRCAAAHMIAGRIMRGAGETAVAIDHMKAAMELAPKSAAFALEYSELMNAQGRFAEAGDAITRAIAAAPNAGAPAAAAVDLVIRAGTPEAAAAEADRLLQRFPHHIGAIRTAAVAYSAVGRHDEAREPLERVLANPDLAATLRGPLLFVLARVRERAGDYQGAWDAARLANELRGLRLDHAAHARRVAAVIDGFDPPAAAVGPPASGPGPRTGRHRSTPRPIFIVGMPRSGTTLVEQIIASHPEVAGAGELGLLERVEHRLESPLPFPRSLSQLGPRGWEAIGAYANGEFAEVAGDRPVVTEKSVSNVFYLGIVPHAFPNARVVFCERDPLDTCVSCYFIDFSAHLPYAYDLTDLGVYHASFDRLVAHWRDTLAVPWMTVRYEELVSDQYSVTRALLDFCGLPFDERCIDFHRNDRPVLTASAEQVRKPLYTTSIGRHSAYDVHLEEFKSALATNAAQA